MSCKIVKMMVTCNHRVYEVLTKKGGIIIW